ncbi:Respiratory supercomplex factor 1, mitochondrial [Paramarasmius palmivorus]|uniref:Respiratory supercomplex factor 1, mitochondrial n=1 Tax=Paramarasmius palmivorus TaxID=297713 RepID=A0AAW0B0L7_9AGAR
MSTPTPTPTTSQQDTPESEKGPYGLSLHRFNETLAEKAIRKCHENPFVPIGVLLTTTALILASRSLRTRNQKQFQFWLRMRVGAQLGTILAVCGGIYTWGQGNLEENVEVQRRIREEMEGKARKEREEFDERVREAERVEKVEQEMRKKLIEKKEVQEEKKTQSSWWKWLGK